MVAPWSESRQKHPPNDVPRGLLATGALLRGYVNDEMVVRREMLHVLLDEIGHPDGYFVDRCHLTWTSWGDERPVAPSKAGLTIDRPAAR